MRKTASTILIVVLASTLLIPQAFAWSQERPSDTFDYGPEVRMESAKTDNNASVGLGVDIWRYDENHNAFENNDIVWLKMSATANVRKGITYDHGEMTSFYWYDVNDDTYYLGDGGSVTIPLPPNIPFLRFYGGPGSAEYNQVTVSGDGFIYLANPAEPINLWEYPDYTEQIPNPVKPNSFIAPFWRNLQGGVIKTGWVASGPYPGWPCFVITWNGIPDLYGNLQTFQVIIEKPPERLWAPHYQNYIYFSYKTITTNLPTTVGIEDQQGAKGVSYNYQNLHNDMTLVFGQTSQSMFIYRLTIKLEKSDPDAIVDISDDTEFLRGYNVLLKYQEIDTTSKFSKALAGTGAMILTALGPVGGILWGAGVVISNILFVVDWADALASLFSPAQVPTDNIREKVDENWVKADADGVPVDAGLGALTYWRFTDTSSDKDHSINISAQLEYFTYDYWGGPYYYHTISTDPIELKVNRDVGDSINDPDVKEISSGTSYEGCTGYPSDTSDFFKVWADSGKIIYTNVANLSNPESGNYVDVDLYLYDQNGLLRAWSNESPISEVIEYAADYTGYWFIEVRRAADSGDYLLSVDVFYPYLTVRTYDISGTEVSGVNVWIDCVQYSSPKTKDVSAGTHTVQVASTHVTSKFIYTFSHWNDSSTSNPRIIDVYSNVTIIAYYNSERRGHQCPTLYVWNGTNYSYEALLDIHAPLDITLQHRIEQPLVKDGIFYKLSLRELDEFTSHIDQVKLYAVDAYGQTYQCFLVSAIHSQQGWVTPLLRFNDETRANLHPTETIDLKFTLFGVSDIAYFTFEINGHNPKWE